MGIKWAKNSSLDWKEIKQTTDTHTHTHTHFFSHSFSVSLILFQPDGLSDQNPTNKTKQNKKTQTNSNMKFYLFHDGNLSQSWVERCFSALMWGFHRAPRRQQPVLIDTPSWTKQRPRRRMKCRGLSLTAFPLFKELGFVYMTHIGQTKETKSSSFPEVRKIQLL